MKHKRLRGQGLVEYGLILVLVAMACAIAVAALGGTLGDWFSGFAIP